MTQAEPMAPRLAPCDPGSTQPTVTSPLWKARESISVTGSEILLLKHWKTFIQKQILTLSLEVSALSPTPHSGFRRRSPRVKEWSSAAPGTEKPLRILLKE